MAGRSQSLQIKENNVSNLHICGWRQNLVAFKSYPLESIGPLACTSDGAYLAGGGASGRVYFWEVATGRLLRLRPGHHKNVGCLFVVLDTEDDGQGAEGQVAAMYGWSDHTLLVTGLLAGSGDSSVIVVSCSLEHTCKIWSLALGTLLRSVIFSTALNAVTLDPGEYGLYAGGADGRIFITASNFGVPITSGILTDGVLGTDTALIGHMYSHKLFLLFS
nr:protein ROOT INITIATION DEFECTIVE 3-like [Physcomitrium patens]|eukprot:XP_024403867.1 protein ROOT INITIATION DEFECTIVE 3-like [Physcomitrella patens]